MGWIWGGGGLFTERRVRKYSFHQFIIWDFSGSWLPTSSGMEQGRLIGPLLERIHMESNCFQMHLGFFLQFNAMQHFQDYSVFILHSLFPLFFCHLSKATLSDFLNALNSCVYQDVVNQERIVMRSWVNTFLLPTVSSTNSLSVSSCMEACVVSSSDREDA